MIRNDASLPPLTCHPPSHWPLAPASCPCLCSCPCYPASYCPPLSLPRISVPCSPAMAIYLPYQDPAPPPLHSASRTPVPSFPSYAMHLSPSCFVPPLRRSSVFSIILPLPPLPRRPSSAPSLPSFPCLPPLFSPHSNGHQHQPATL